MYCDCPVLTRCCFCLPLRRGVLTFGYINLFFGAFMVFIYSSVVHHNLTSYSNSHVLPAELSITLYCTEILFTIVLIYGTHKRLVPYIRAYYYFSVTATLAELLISIIEYANAPDQLGLLQFSIITFGSFFTNLYLIVLVKSLLRKFEMDGPSLYDNPLHQIVTGEVNEEQCNSFNEATDKPVHL